LIFCPANIAPETVMLFDSGKVASSFVGVRARGEYEQAIDDVLKTKAA